MNNIKLSQRRLLKLKLYNKQFSRKTHIEKFLDIMDDSLLSDEHVTMRLIKFSDSMTSRHFYTRLYKNEIDSLINTILPELNDYGRVKRVCELKLIKIPNVTLLCISLVETMLVKSNLPESHAVINVNNSLATLGCLGNQIITFQKLIQENSSRGKEKKDLLHRAYLAIYNKLILKKFSRKECYFFISQFNLALFPRDPIAFSSFKTILRRQKNKK